MIANGKGLEWQVASFAELSPQALYRILGARVAVFVVEQDCPYQDIDGLDADAVHVTAWSGDQVLAYARILGPGVRFPEPAIGRVLTAMPARGTGLGRELMNRAIAATEERWPGAGMRISAQQYLERFYRDLGFETVRGPYPEDGIAHLEMHRAG